MLVRIAPLETVEDVENFRQLTCLVWESPLEDAIPVHVLVTVAHNGGGMLGAFADDGPAATGGMVGLALWWPGLAEPTTGDRPHGLHLKMCSHMAGVLPAWQGTGLGLRLKLAQRDAILAQAKTDWVTWTYDPLLRTNAAFNIHRLGAVCNTYYVNLYGAMVDGLNAGWDSDRCQVDWWLGSRRVQERALGPKRPAAPALPEGAQVLRPPDAARGAAILDDQPLHLDGRALAVPIPDDITALRTADPALGNQWRLYLRRVLEQAFAGGYCIADFGHLANQGWHYALVPTPSLTDL